MRRKNDVCLARAIGSIMKSVLVAFRMATVNCDICGGVFSQSYLTSHKSLAHSKNDPSPVAPITENEAIRKIASLYESLSVNGQKHIVRLLTAKDQKAPKDQKIQKPE